MHTPVSLHHPPGRTSLLFCSLLSTVSQLIHRLTTEPYVRTVSPFAIDSSIQAELIKVILDDLKAAGHGNKGRLSSKGILCSSICLYPLTGCPDAAQGLLAVKNLGKNPSTSEYLSSPRNLSTLLGLFTTFKDDQDASSEALRCIANALLLVEDARSTFILKEVDGGSICISLLEVSRSLCHIIFHLSFVLEINGSWTNIHSLSYPVLVHGLGISIYSIAS